LVGCWIGPHSLLCKKLGRILARAHARSWSTGGGREDSCGGARHCGMTGGASLGRRKPVSQRTHASHLTAFQGLATFYSQLFLRKRAFDGGAGLGLCAGQRQVYNNISRSRLEYECLKPVYTRLRFKSWDSSESGSAARNSGVPAQQGFTHAYCMVVKPCGDMWSWADSIGANARSLLRHIRQRCCGRACDGHSDSG
jgi:hypothetical protein